MCICSTAPPPPDFAQRLQQLRQRVHQREAAAVVRRPGAHQQRGSDHVQELLLREPGGPRPVTRSVSVDRTITTTGVQAHVTVMGSLTLIFYVSPWIIMNNNIYKYFRKHFLHKYLEKIAKQSPWIITNIHKYCCRNC